jgi:hypothetical protein
MVAHASLTGANLHEPKGAASASADTVYVADGAGSGSWVKVDSANIDTTSIFNTNKFTLTAVLDDVSTASSVYIPMPFACTVNSVYSALQAAITGADATVTVRNNSDTSMGTLTIAQSGSAAGDVDSLSPSSNNTFTAGQRMRIQTDGASTDTAKLVFVIVVTQTS